MATNQAFAQGGNVTLASGQTKALTPAQMALRNKNLKTQESYIENTSILKDKTIENGGVLSNGAQTVTPTVEATPTNIDPLQQATLNIGEAQKEALDANAENEKAYTDNYNANLAQIEESKKENLASAEQYFNENEKLITQAGNEINAIEQGQISSYEDRINRDTALINSKKASEIALLQAEANKQKVDNENAIKEARYNVEIQRQQSAWAYNKIGLSMSSGIINQSQQIATQGIAKIAEIRAMMSYQEANIDAKVADVEFNYTKLVNDTIDKYSDAIDGIKKNMIERINETKKDMIKNSYDKRTTIQEIKDWATQEKQKADRQHIEDITKVKDRGITLQKDIQKTIEEYQTRELTKLDTMMKTGTITRLSPVQIAQKERELGLPAGTIDAQIDIGITQDIRKQYDAVLGEDYFIDNITTLTNDVRNEMKQGRTMEQALQTVIARDLKDNPVYAQMQEDKRIKTQLEQDKQQAEIDKLYNTMETDRIKANATSYNAETSRIKALKEDNSNITTPLTFSGLSSKGDTLINVEDGTDLTSTGREQCGEYFNDITDRKFPMGDLMEDKLSVANITDVVEGDAVGRGAVWDAGNSVNGHVGIIMDEDAGGYWIKSSNINNDGKVSTDYIAKEDILGFTEKAFDGFENKVDYLTEKGVDLPKNATQQQLDALYNKEVKNEGANIIASYEKGLATVDEFNQDFAEEISNLASLDKSTIKDGFSKIFGDFESKGIDKNIAKAYLIKAGIVSETKKWNQFGTFYIDGDVIKRVDKMRDTVVYNLK